MRAQKNKALLILDSKSHLLADDILCSTLLYKAARSVDPTIEHLIFVDGLIWSRILEEDGPLVVHDIR